MKLYESFVSDGEEWNRLYQAYESEAVYQMHACMRQALQIVEEAGKFCMPEAEVQGPKAEITEMQLIKLENLRGGLSEFCRTVQKEAEDRIDDAFYYPMMKAVHALYELDPGGIVSPDGKRSLSGCLLEMTGNEGQKPHLQKMLEEVDTDAPDENTKLALITAVREHYADNYQEYMTGKDGLDATAFYQDVETVITLYEEIRPGHGQAMDTFFREMKQDMTKDYTRDIANMKFLAYTAAEPYRTVFLTNIGQIELADYEYTERQHYSNGKIYINFSGIENGKNDKKGAYTTIMHEIGHAIYDRSPDPILRNENGKAEKGTASLQTRLEQDLRKALRNTIDVYLEKVDYTLTEEEIEAVIQEIISAESDSENLGNDNLEDTYGYLRQAYGWKEMIISGDGGYEGKDIIGTEYNLIGADNATLSDIIGGFTNNTIGGYSYGHTQNKKDIGVAEYYYWYNQEGEATGRQADEFFAEYFSYQMTGNTEAIKNTEEFFVRGSKYVKKYFEGQPEVLKERVKEK